MIIIIYCVIVCIWKILFVRFISNKKYVICIIVKEVYCNMYLSYSCVYILIGRVLEGVLLKEFVVNGGVLFVCV